MVLKSITTNSIISVISGSVPCLVVLLSMCPIFVFCYMSCDFLKGAAAAAKSLQLCPTLCDLVDGSLPGSRQEHWSGLPFPSPMHESEK